jgi:hypothetical protein
MTVRSGGKKGKHDPPEDAGGNRDQGPPLRGHRPSEGHLVAALVIVAAVILGTLLITQSPEAVVIVTGPLLIVLAWWLGRPPDSFGQ